MRVANKVLDRFAERVTENIVPREVKSDKGLKFVFSLCIGLSISSLLTTRAAAQQVIEEIMLDEGVALRLGIQFRAVAPIGDDAGIKISANVVSSLDEGAHSYSTVDGVLSEWFVTSGESVAKGDLLARIASNSANEIQGQWLDAVAVLSAANFEANRSERLFSQGVVAQRRLQHAQIALEGAMSKEASARKALERIGFDDFAIKRLGSANENLGYALLRATSAGVLVHQALNLSEPVKVGDEIAELQLESPKWLSFKLPAKLAKGVVGKTRLSVVGTGETLTLRRRDYAIDRLTQTIEAYAEFDVEVDYPLGSVIDVLIEPTAGGVLIPAAAVVYTEGKTNIYVQTADGVIPRVIDLIPIGRDYAATGGINAGEVIAVSGTALLKGMQLGLGGDF